MTTTLVFTLPYFNKLFVIESNTSGAGIRVVLMQKSHPIAYTSKVFSISYLSLSVYDKEMLVIVHIVIKWRPYLIDQ